MKLENPPAASSLQTRAVQPRLVQTHRTLLRYEFICQVGFQGNVLMLQLDGVVKKRQ